MKTYKTKVIGYGLGYNEYPHEFEFTMNEEPTEEETKEKAYRYARIKGKRKTACDSLTVVWVREIG